MECRRSLDESTTAVVDVIEKILIVIYHVSMNCLVTWYIVGLARLKYGFVYGLP